MNDPNPRDPFPQPTPPGLPTWAKVVLWILGVVVLVPVLGLLLLFGYCATR
jgi:hypothetical protein